jgi:hypothetical protein
MKLSVDSRCHTRCPAEMTDSHLPCCGAQIENRSAPQLAVCSECPYTETGVQRSQSLAGHPEPLNAGIPVLRSCSSNSFDGEADLQSAGLYSLTSAANAHGGLHGGYRLEAPSMQLNSYSYGEP